MRPVKLRLIAARGAFMVLAALLAGAALAACAASMSADALVAVEVDAMPTPNVAAAGGTSASDFQLVVYEGQDILGGREVAFSEILAQGRPIVLNFWAGACPPCRREMPDLQHVYDLNKDRLLMVGVDGGPFLGLGTASEAENLIREMNITYPTGTALDGQVLQAYGVVGMPTTYFIKPGGEIVGRRLGLLTREKLMELVDDLIDESEVR